MLLLAQMLMLKIQTATIEDVYCADSRVWNKHAAEVNFINLDRQRVNAGIKPRREAASA